MSVASLPMYDLPELRAAHAALWAGIARHLRQAGGPRVPAALCQDRPVDEVWRDPDAAAQPVLRRRSHGRLRRQAARRSPRLATGRPAVRAALCEPGRGRRGRGRSGSSRQLRGRVAAINDPESHSGTNALRALIAPLSRDGRFFAAVEVSGAHVASLAMVASGAADVAAIDCVTHALLARHRPAALAGTRVLCRTAAAPAPPYVTRADAGDDLVLPPATALRAALADPALGSAREQLLLDGIELLPPAAYRRIPAFARLARPPRLSGAALIAPADPCGASRWHDPFDGAASLCPASL